MIVLIALERLSRWNRISIRGLPSIVFKTFPGRRLEPIRAWTIATTFCAIGMGLVFVRC